MKFDALTHKLKNNHNKTIKSTEETFIHFIMHSHLRCMSSHGTHGSDKCRKEKQTTKKKREFIFTFYQFLRNFIMHLFKTKSRIVFHFMAIKIIINVKISKHYRKLL